MVPALKAMASYLFFLLLHLCLVYAGYECPAAACGEGFPPIRFPFWLKGRQPENCGDPGFELSCSEKNQTLIEFPTSGKFLVTDINYEFHYIEITDPGGCIVKRLLTLNVTGSPFMNSMDLNYTLLNCSSRVEREDLTLIDCLSSSTHHVYAAPASMDVIYLDLSSCGNGFITNFKTSNHGFLHNKTELSWDIPGCDGCGYGGKKCRFKSNTSRELECYDGPRYANPNEDKSTTKIKGVCIGISIAVLSLVLIVTLIIMYLRWRRAEAEEKWKKIRKFLEEHSSLNPTRYSFSDVQKITKEFRKKLGQGGYGSVFQGELENGVPVAVKVLNNSKGSGEDFTNEVSTIGRIHHVNVVRLLGYCADGSHRALVYEFMPNKSLDKLIFPLKLKRPKLGWGKLKDIAIGVARGIEYLHHGCDQRILHFDIKPQNILLDIDFNPKISDFGLAKLFPKMESVVPITAVRGTMGYIAPEVYFSGNIGNVSYKTDVYSFGMLLFEIVGGRKNKDLTVENISQVYFPQWVYNRLADGEDLGIKEEKDGDADIAKNLAVVALRCVQWEPSDRPPISTVVQMLEGRTGSLSLPPDPFASLNWEESDENQECPINTDKS